MLALMFLSTVVGGFSYTIDTTGTRSRPVASAPPGYDPSWTEKITRVVATSPADRALNTFLSDAVESYRSDHYDGTAGSPDSSFETMTDAGWVDIDERVLAASPDMVSLDLSSESYSAGMAHPQPGQAERVTWSRRLHRPLRQDDVFASAPDRVLRRLALARYDNREGITVADFPEGLPLDWHHASVGPTGISWSFAPYELGGYPSGGTTTIPWAALRPYLARRLPFVIGTIRAAPAPR